MLLVLAVAFVGLGVWAWVDEGPLWQWAMMEKIFVEAPKISGLFHEFDGGRGWEQRPRWSFQPRAARYVVWYPKTGYLAKKGRSFGGAVPRIDLTVWKQDGSVMYQSSLAVDYSSVERKHSPPWLWNVTDQTEPTMPEWMKDDAQWQAALDAQE